MRTLSARPRINLARDEPKIHRILCCIEHCRLSSSTSTQREGSEHHWMYRDIACPWCDHVHRDFGWNTQNHQRWIDWDHDLDVVNVSCCMCGEFMFSFVVFLGADKSMRPYLTSMLPGIW